MSHAANHKRPSPPIEAGSSRVITPSRRELLQVGCSAFFGLGLSAALSGRAQAAAAGRKPKSVILVFLSGGGSHIDSFDPKPDASDNVRGEFATIATKVPGVQFSEHVPKLAARADRLAVVRSMAHRDNRHLSATHHFLTGTPQAPRGNANEDKQLNRRDWPCYGAAVGHLRPRDNGLPSGVTLPNRLVEGPLTWPGQHAGVLGAKHDPLEIQGDPSKSDFRVSGLSLPEGLSLDRLEHRRGLLERLNSQHAGLDAWARRRQFTGQREAAYSMLTSGKIATALDIASEPDKVRDHYGRHKFGQSLLLARKLVEAGVPIVQANMGIVQTWDTHVDNFPKLKDRLLPPLDQGVSALLDDLQQRGMWDDTMVVVVGEFGRTPKISKLSSDKVPGRGHWAWAYTALLAGGGVRGGQVIGASDKIGAYPVTDPYSPSDLGATIYDALGIDPGSIIHDPLNRPMHLNSGQVMGELF